MTQAGGTRWLMQSRGAGAVEPVLCCVLLRVPWLWIIPCRLIPLADGVARSQH